MVGSGLVKAMGWGASVLGVSDVQLESMTASGAKALNAAKGGIPDLKFAAAVGFKNFGAHPAFDAHIKPVAAWSTALRQAASSKNPAVTTRALERSFEVQLGLARRNAACKTGAWTKVAGPVAAVIATTARLGWTPLTATRWITESGVSIDKLALSTPLLLRLVQQPLARAVAKTTKTGAAYLKRTGASEALSLPQGLRANMPGLR